MKKFKSFCVAVTFTLLLFCVHCGLKTEPVAPELVKEGRKPVVGIGAPKPRPEADEKEILDLYGEKTIGDPQDFATPPDAPKDNEAGDVDWDKWPEMPEDESADDASENSETEKPSEEPSTQPAE